MKKIPTLFTRIYEGHKIVGIKVNAKEEILKKDDNLLQQYLREV